MRLVLAVTLAIGSIVAPALAASQQSADVPRIGYLGSVSAPTARTTGIEL